MDVKEIKKFVDLMIRNDLCELEIQDGDTRLSLKRGSAEAPPAVTFSQAPPVQLAPAASLAQPIAPGGTENPTQAEQKHESIVSPMVGTFYPSADPESPPFIQAGDSVAEETVVCIIEAMKVMNEIKAGLSGTVEKVLVKNGQAVEFGQPMFLVRQT